MRLIDFFVFYEATLYKNKEEENRLGNQRLGKAIRVASMIVGTWLTIIIQLMVFLVLKRNIINADNHTLVITIVVMYFIAGQILQSVYITKDRYQYIISNDYPPFTLGKHIGILIIILTLLVSVALSVGIQFYR